MSETQSGTVIGIYTKSCPIGNLGNWWNIARSGINLVVQEVVKRESLGAIPYGPDEHRLNPYIGGNLQAVKEFIKRDSELAAF